MSRTGRMYSETPEQALVSVIRRRKKQRFRRKEIGVHCEDQATSG